MDCPVCKEAMITLEAEQVEVDYCPGCGGVWLDAGELEMLVADEERAKEILGSFKVAQSSSERPRRCPICLKKMEKVKAGTRGEVLIDRCRKRHGLWFDRAELGSVLRMGVTDTDERIEKLLADIFGDESRKERNQMAVEKESFGKLADGREVQLYRLTGAGGMQAEVITYGATVRSLSVPVRGAPRDVVLGYDNVQGYVQDSAYTGAIAGRYANRIAKGRFTLEGQEYKLAVNNGPNHLHGGLEGFNKKLWDAEPLEEKDRCGVRLHYVSPDGEEGYPGKLETTVTYWVNDDNALMIEYEAHTDKTTVVNLTHHGYFNLTGDFAKDILGHQFQLHADGFTAVDENLIPTGEIKPVAGTPLDFRKPTTAAARIDRVPGGYDHNFVINGKGGELSPAARVTEPQSGLVMEVQTTEPGMQFYTGNFLDGSAKGKGVAFDKHSGFCLEAQHFPDSPNQPQFPSVILEPDQVYRQTTTYKFSTE